MDNKVYTPDDIAQILQISKHTVYELIKRGELAAFKVGNMMRIEEQALDSFKKNQATGKKTGKVVEKEAKKTTPKQMDKDLTSSNSLRMAGSHDILLEKLFQSIHEDSF